MLNQQAHHLRRAAADGRMVHGEQVVVVRGSRGLRARANEQLHHAETGAAEGGVVEQGEAALVEILPYSLAEIVAAATQQGTHRVLHRPHEIDAQLGRPFGALCNLR